MKKVHVALLFGGRSAEHDVSIMSVKSVYEALDREKYDISLIEITQSGEWFLQNEGYFLGERASSERVTLPPESGGKLCFLGNHARCEKIDVVFPILHGPYGEDGTVQGLLELAGTPYVGAGVLGSAIGMDKDVMKRLLRDVGIPVARFLVFRAGRIIDHTLIENKIGFPCFVKPANLGSSVGVSKCENIHELELAVREAFRYDRKILIEEAIIGREIECAVLGNESPQASILGEVRTGDTFYSYSEKYSSDQKTKIEIPADIDPDITERIRTMAVQSYQVLECEGMGRVDFFLRANGDILVNEINTLPGFTAYSMYPKLWIATGISYQMLIDELIRFAIARFEAKSRLQTSHEYFQELDRPGVSDWEHLA